MTITGTVASYERGQTTITVELSARGFDVIISGPGRLPSRVGTYSARFKALAAAAALAGQEVTE